MNGEQLDEFLTATDELLDASDDMRDYLTRVAQVRGSLIKKYTEAKARYEAAKQSLTVDGD